jgi:lathosterol oxidase
MDFILEVFDTFIGDHVWAAILPAKAAPYDFPQTAANATTVEQSFSTWTYKPASEYIYIEPYQAAYMSAWSRDNVWRQGISLYTITWLFGVLIYFVFATLSYVFVFDKRTLNHPKFLKNQIWLEIVQANKALPVMATITAPIFLLEVRGYGCLYDRFSDAPAWWYNYAQFPLFLVFTDCLIYWIHRGLHHPLVYKHLHKAHHKWIMPTPFASHAFHPLDGYAQGLPYHLFPFIFPLQKFAYVALFIFVNFWTIMIHDGEYVTENPIVNGAACHSLHHSKFEVNYGQFFTVFDRLGGTYRRPDAEMFEREVRMSEKQWSKEAKEFTQTVLEIEGNDDRTYDGGAVAKKTN